MNYLLSQIFLCLLAAFILGLLIGWLIRHVTCKKCQDEVLMLQSEITRLNSEKRETKPQVVVHEVEKIVETAVFETPVPETTESLDRFKPIFLNQPKNDQGDDLKRIKGIGKVLEGTLYELGVYHFEQISSWSDGNVQWMDDFMQFPGRIERENWVSQAHLLASGGETEFSKKVDDDKIYD